MPGFWHGVSTQSGAVAEKMSFCSGLRSSTRAETQIITGSHCFEMNFSKQKYQVEKEPVRPVTFFVHSGDFHPC